MSIILAVTVFATSTSFAWSVGGAILSEELISTINQVYWPVATVVAMGVAKHNLLLKSIRQNVLLVILLALCVISSVWSLNPGITLQRSALAVMVSLIAASISTRLNIAAITKITLIVLLTIASVGIVDGIASTGIVGLYPIKAGYNSRNAFGLSLGLAISLAYPRISADSLLTSRIKRILLVMALMIILVLADSRTSLIAAITSCLAVSATKFIMRGRRKKAHVSVMALFGIVGLVFVFGLVFQADIFQILGRDSSLTGRTNGWIHAVQLITERPLLGYGFDGYWGSDVGLALQSNLNWSYASFHDNYIEYFVDLGVIGLVVLIMLLLKLHVAGFKLLTEDRLLGLSLIGFAVALMVASFTESLLQRPNGIWYLYFCLMTFMTKSYEADKHRFDPLVNL